MEVLQWPRQHNRDPEPPPRQPGRPAEPVPVAFLGRTSTLALQDPRASLRRQIRVRPGLAAARAGSSPPATGTSSPAAWTWNTAATARPGRRSPAPGPAPRRRHGRPARRGRRPAPRFAAVVCEDIERSGRDTFNALKLEKKLSRQGIPLFATDEPAVIEGVNATTVLVRRVKQGVAEWYRLQLKEKTWKGLSRARPGRVEHRHRRPTGTRRPDPAPGPGQGRPGPHQDPPRPGPGPRPGRRADLHLAGRGQARLPGHRRPAQRRPGRATRPHRATGLDRPDRLGHPGQPQVHRAHGLRPASAPATAAASPSRQTEWLWSPEPVHPAIVDRATWDAAQQVGAEHGTSRDGDEPDPHPAATRTYPYRSRVRCRDCRRRMAGTAYGLRRRDQSPTTSARTTPPTPGTPPPTPTTAPSTLREDPAHGRHRRPFFDHVRLRPRPRRPARRPAPRHRRRPRRARRPARRAPARPSWPASTPPSAPDPRTRAARRPGRPGRPGLPGPDPRPVRRAPRRAHRHRNPARRPPAATPDDRPRPARRAARRRGTCPGAPARIKDGLLDAFDIQVLYRHDHGQVTIRAALTDDTPRTITALLDDPRTDNDTNTATRTQPLFTIQHPPLSGVQISAILAAAWRITSAVTAAPCPPPHSRRPARAPRRAYFYPGVERQGADVHGHRRAVHRDHRPVDVGRHVREQPGDDRGCLRGRAGRRAGTSEVTSS